jgi:hypothetical protein
MRTCDWLMRTCDWLVDFADDYANPDRRILKSCLSSFENSEEAGYPTAMTPCSEGAQSVYENANSGQFILKGGTEFGTFNSLIVTCLRI